MELLRPSMPRELRADLVDALSHDENGTVHRFGEKISKRPVEAAREHHALAVLRDEGERAVYFQYGSRIRAKQPTSGVVVGRGPESLTFRSDQIDHAGDWLLHGYGFVVFCGRDGLPGVAPPRASARCSALNANATPFVQPKPSCRAYSPPPARRLRSTTSYFSTIRPVARYVRRLSASHRSRALLARATPP